MRDLIHPQIVVERIGMNHDEGQTFAGNFVVDSQAVRGGIGHRKVFKTFNPFNRFAPFKSR
jgi:hypothetical protein